MKASMHSYLINKPYINKAEDSDNKARQTKGPCPIFNIWTPHCRDFLVIFAGKQKILLVIYLTYIVNK